MIRSDLEQDAPHVSLVVRSSTGVTMMHRPSRGADTASKCVGVHSRDLEMRIVKAGDMFDLFYRQANDGSDWFHLDSVSVGLGPTYRVGRAVASNDLIRWPYRATMVT